MIQEFTLVGFRLHVFVGHSNEVPGVIELSLEFFYILWLISLRMVSTVSVKVCKDVCNCEISLIEDLNSVSFCAEASS